MKNVVFVFLLCLIQLTAFSQKVRVKVIKADNAAASGWQILDEKYQVVFSGNEFSRTDSVMLSLEANKRYFLEISVGEIVTNDTNFYSLVLNNEPIMLLNTGIGSGDHVYPFFTGVRNEENKITGGATTTISEFPWQVYYISGNFRCGGSIIADTWILTAAHCTRNNFGVAIPVSTMYVKAGANNPNNASEGQLYNVSEVIVHEGYDSQTLVNDIALLRLQQPINTPNARPIKLITSEDVAYGATDPGVMTWVTGWGLTHVNPNTSPSGLQKVQLPVITNAEASTVWGPIPSTDIMAGYLNGNKDACSGDSGGPMAVPVFDDYKVAGIVSWGSQNCNTYGGYTRVSDFENWIREKTGIPKNYIPPVPVGDTLICSSVVSSQYTVGTISGASAYEWQLSPAEAGVVNWNNGNAVVTWNPGFIGSGTLIMRVTINGTVSEWSRLYLKVVPVTKQIAQSADTTLCAENSVFLSVSAEGYNLNYKWYKNGVMVQSGSSNILNFISAKTSNSGIYKCQTNGYCNSVVSSDINFTVYPLTNITSVSPDVSVPFGDDVTIDILSEGHNLSYQWQKDGVIIDNSNSPKLYLYDLNATDIGLYNTTVTGTCGTVTSDSIYVYVKQKDSAGEPEVFLWPSATTSEFNVALSNDGVYSVFIYNISGQAVKEISNCRYQTTVDVTALSRGSYIVRVVNGEFRKSLRLTKL